MTIGHWPLLIVLQVRQIIIHESFQGDDHFQADIALLSLDSKVELSLTVMPACFNPDVDLISKGAIGEVNLSYMQNSFGI
jgi:hypothetical protein